MASKVGFLHDYGQRRGQIISESDSLNVHDFEISKTNIYSEGVIPGGLYPNVWWKLSEAGGTGWAIDSASAGATGYVQGTGVTQGVAGYSGLCAYFAGANGRIESLPDDSGGNHPTGRNFSVTMMVNKPNTAYNYNGILYFFRYITYLAGFYVTTLGDWGDASLGFRARRSYGGYQIYCDTATTWSKGNWYHLAFTHSDTGRFMRIWVDGAEAGYLSWPSYEPLGFTVIGQSYIGIGTTRASYGRHYIDEYKFFANRILTTDQVIADMG